MAQVDLSFDLVDRAIVDAEQGRRLFIEGVVGALVDQRHLAAHIFLHEFLRAHQVELIVLLQDLQRAGIVYGTQAYRLRKDGGGNIHETQRSLARQHFDGTPISYERAVVVIYRYGHVRLVVNGGLARH